MNELFDLNKLIAEIKIVSYIQKLTKKNLIEEILFLLLMLELTFLLPFELFSFVYLNFDQ